MLAVKTIQDLTVAKELCEMCKVPFKADSYTYFAADVNEDATKINHIIGVCTCRMKGDLNEIEYLMPAPGVEDEEALMIMARTVMNFMYRCEVKKITVADEYTSPELARKLGFSVKEGVLSIDLVEFYKSPCKFNG